MGLDSRFDLLKRTSWGGLSLSATELKRLEEAAERSSRIGTSSPNASLRQSDMGTVLVDNSRPQAWGRITGVSGTAYAWNTATDSGTGTWSDTLEGPAGTTTANSAYEISGSTSVPTDGSAIVRMYLSDDGEHWVFAYPTPPTQPITINNYSTSTSPAANLLVWSPTYLTIEIGTGSAFVIPNVILPQYANAAALPTPIPGWIVWEDDTQTPKFASDTTGWKLPNVITNTYTATQSLPSLIYENTTLNTLVVNDPTGTPYPASSIGGGGTSVLAIDHTYHAFAGSLGTLFTYTVKANTLKAAGDCLSFDFAGNANNTACSCEIKLVLNSQTLLDDSLGLGFTTGALGWRCRGRIMLLSDGTANVTIELINGQTVACSTDYYGGTGAPNTPTGGLDWDADQTLTLSGANLIGGATVVGYAFAQLQVEKAP